MDAIMIVIKSGPLAQRVEEGLRLSAAMLGYDKMPAIFFVDDGVECLREGAFEDPTMEDYLEAASDLAGIYALSESLDARGILPGDIDGKIAVTALDVAGLAEMMSGCDAVATF